MDGRELDDTQPLLVAGRLVTEHEGKSVVPVGERPALLGIDVARVLAVDVDLLAVDRIVRQHEVLQGGLRIHIGGGGLQRRGAVGVCLIATRAALVLHRMLPESCVARGRAARVADDVCIGLRHVGRGCPDFE